MQPDQATLLEAESPLADARYDSGFGAFTPAQQMLIVQAATAAVREHEASAGRTESVTEVTVGSWAAGMEAVWGALSAMEQKPEPAGNSAAEGAARAPSSSTATPPSTDTPAASAGPALVSTIDGIQVAQPQLTQEGSGTQPELVETLQVEVTADGIIE